MSTVETWGSRLRQYRVQVGLSQAELAEKVGAHPITVSKWERNVGRPRLTQLSRLANTLSIPPEELLRQRPGPEEMVDLETDPVIQAVRAWARATNRRGPQWEALSRFVEGLAFYTASTPGGGDEKVSH